MQVRSLDFSLIMLLILACDQKNHIDKREILSHTRAREHYPDDRYYDCNKNRYPHQSNDNVLPGFAMGKIPLIVFTALHAKKGGKDALGYIPQAGFAFAGLFHHRHHTY